MSAVTQPSLFKSKTLFRENLHKNYIDLYFSTKKSKICIFCAI